MPSIINAPLSGGVTITSDTSGVLQLQTASTNALSINASQQVQVNTGGSASAPVISKSDDTNTGIFFPAADTIAFTEGGAESMRIDSIGRVGIGAVPVNSFTAHSTLQVGAQAMLAANGALSSTGQTYLSHNLYFDTSGNFAVFNTSTANEGAVIQLADGECYISSSDATTATPVVTQVFSVKKGSTIALQGATGKSGTGITFPATQSASSDANTLDDYEEGTWTPIATSSGGSITAYSSNGKYTKIGRVVTLFGSITVSNVGSASGPLNIAAVPFATLDSEQYSGVSREAVINGANNFVTISNTTGYIQSITGGAISWTNGSSFRFVITYQTS
jgi:hypothetical protein